MTTAISKATLARLPIYLNCLKSMPDTSEYVSATTLANELGFGEVQVRKDLASISDAGKPKVGYMKKELISVLENYLGADVNDAEMANLIRRLGVKIGIITLPKEYAQETADKLIEAGIRAIWNFSPTYIKVPDNVAVKNENMASSLAVLSKQLRHILESEK